MRFPVVDRRCRIVGRYLFVEVVGISTRNHNETVKPCMNEGHVIGGRRIPLSSPSVNTKYPGGLVSIPSSLALLYRFFTNAHAKRVRS